MKKRLLNGEIIDLTNGVDDYTWIKKAKKRKRYKFYYDFVFWLKLKHSKTKKIQKNNIIKIMRLDEELGLYKNQNK
tara:strand:- start:293 stop:520 length:228 start_codon:yes stop_codon:yes gene_type:complete